MIFSRSRSLSVTDAAAAHGRGELLIIDVRERAELAAARVEGALHIPLAQLAGRLGEIDRSRPVAFLCHSGSRSAYATKLAKKAGIDAANVKGGMIAWSRAQLPLSQGAKRSKRSKRR